MTDTSRRPGTSHTCTSFPASVSSRRPSVLKPPSRPGPGNFWNRACSLPVSAAHTPGGSFSPRATSQRPSGLISTDLGGLSPRGTLA